MGTLGSMNQPHYAESRIISKCVTSKCVILKCIILKHVIAGFHCNSPLNGTVFRNIWPDLPEGNYDTLAYSL